VAPEKGYHMSADQGRLTAQERTRLWRARLAVAAIFCANSAVLTAWITRIPDVKARLGLSEGTLGLALLCMALGALISQPAVGWLLGHIGSRRITTVAALVFCVSIMLPAAATELWLLLIALFVFGALNGGLDVAMNAQAAQVEQGFGRPIMASFHGLWSVGGLVGSVLGGVAADSRLPLGTHFALAGALGLVTVAVAVRWLWPDGPSVGAHGPSFALPPRSLLTMGVIAFAVLICEGAVADWSAVYLRESLGSGPGLAAAGYSAFALLMAIGRLTGDRLTERVGPQALVRGGGVLVVLGMARALLSATPLLAIAGFACVGAGVACIFPVLLSMAARTPGVSPGVGIAAIATAGYTGFLVGPPLIGSLAELSSLGSALGVLALAGALTAALAGTLRRSTGLGAELEGVRSSEA
jgi:MFS family permease